ncbi:hypothetical protein SEMRO_782_G201810.1 [Seminavis robusta]|uniref:Uncharacterized protein n=1 Tax=Seminavis robusta TaxID=568900 RepID=A0A9N8E8V0_9STRA|nr:hypothetical protein SEMRO_782_G201810.1 [Seminavis robusta]|eukprot:Sro782_g201810.1 n/a (199) ;mRNA; f:45941-46537
MMTPPREQRLSHCRSHFEAQIQPQQSIDCATGAFYECGRSDNLSHIGFYYNDVKSTRTGSNSNFDTEPIMFGPILVANIYSKLEPPLLVKTDSTVATASSVEPIFALFGSNSDNKLLLFGANIVQRGETTFSTTTNDKIAINLASHSQATFYLLLDTYFGDRGAAMMPQSFPSIDCSQHMHTTDHTSNSNSSYLGILL